MVNNPVCEDEGVAVFWKQGLHTNKDVTASRPDILIKNKKKKIKHAY
jgi:hypothetical protein